MKVFQTAAGRSVAIGLSILALVLALGAAYARAGTQNARQARAILTEHRLKLLNGWHSADRGNETGAPAFRVSGGIVYLSGSARQPSQTNPELAALPKSARPKHLLYVPVYTSEGATGTLQVFPNGAVIALSNVHGSAQAFTSLAGVSFPVGS